MFLGVSGTVRTVTPTDEDRARIAAAVQARRLAVFHAKKAAYTAARLNPGTWDRLEAGQSIREDRLASAVQTLWPDTGGDWRKIPDVGGDSHDASYVDSPGETMEAGISNADLMRELLRQRAEYDQLRAGQNDLRAGFESLSKRVAQLEQQGP